MVPVDCSVENVEVVDRKLRGGAGPSSVDAVSIQKWMLLYGKAL